jgi:hypothetical protein
MVAPIWLALVGAKAKSIRHDYDVRVVTDKRFAAAEVWLELTPRSASARAVFSQLVVILKRPDLHPYAVRITSANGGDCTVFEFRRVKFNDIFAADIRAPTPPEGWRVVLAGHDVPAAAPATATIDIPQSHVSGQTCGGRRRLIRALLRRR